MDAILLIIEPITVKADAFTVYGKSAADHNIPVGGALMVAEDYGTIFGLSTHEASVGRQAVNLADKILRGTPAGTIPVVSAESYLRLNYRMAHKMGLVVPEEVLNLADEIIR
jgi:putative ABC transport system substrate-binding protein